VSPIRVIARPSDQITITREIDLLFAACWALFGVWGILAGLKGLPSVQESAGHNYTFLLAFATGISGIGACVSAVMIFFKSRFGQVTKKRLERTFCWALLFSISYYPIALALTNNWPAVILLFIFMCLPIYRIRHLSYRIRLYHDSAAGI
jgi:uncharacterized membrane protein